MSRATNVLLEALTNGQRDQVDSLPIAGKLLLLQWIHSSLTADIGDLAGKLAPLTQSFAGQLDSGTHFLGSAPEPPGEAFGGMGGRFRRGGHQLPETPVEDGSA